MLDFAAAAIVTGASKGIGYLWRRSSPFPVRMSLESRDDGSISTSSATKLETQGCNVIEPFQCIVRRWITAAPEAPAFLGTELVHSQRCIPLIEFRTVRFIRLVFSFIAQPPGRAARRVLAAPRVDGKRADTRNIPVQTSKDGLRRLHDQI